MPAANLAPYLAKWGLPETVPVAALAYTAGFFDGEGCIQLTKPRVKSRAYRPEARVTLQVSVVNTDPRPLEILAPFFGGAVARKTHARYTPVHHKPSYYWTASGKKAAHFLWKIEPYLVVKREQAQCALLFAETYFADWRHCDMTGWPLTEEAAYLRRTAIRGFRAAMDARIGRGVAWRI